MSMCENLWIGCGFLEKQPVLLETKSKTRLARFPLSTFRRWTDGRTGELVEEVMTHQCVAWDPPDGVKGQRLATLVEQFYRKGKQVYVKARVEYRRWIDGQGVQREGTEMVVTEIIFLGGRWEAKEFELDEEREALRVGTATEPTAGPNEIDQPYRE